MDRAVLRERAPLDFRGLTDRACKRLARNLPVRRKLPAGGAIHIERQLPYLCIYRPSDDAADPARHLITTEASYIIAPADPELHDEFVTLCTAVAQLLQEHFGAFLLLEVRTAAGPVDAAANAFGLPSCSFRIFSDGASPTSADALATTLQAIELNGQPARVERAGWPPPAARPFLSLLDAAVEGCAQIVLEVAPVFRDPQTGDLYPLLFENLRRQLGQALKQSFCAFSGWQTSDPPKHFEALGRRVLARAVGDIDRKLAEIADRFEFLLLVTPVNTQQAWHEFEASGFESDPQWHYRPLPFDPDLVKRDLFNLPLERVEDPTLRHLLRQKRDSMDRELTMLRERGQRGFLYSSLHEFGAVDAPLLEVAQEILRRITPEDQRGTRVVGATEFAAHAAKELEHYQTVCRGFRAKIELRDDIPAGVMVSRDRLLISQSLSISPDRVRPLLQHEIGTHLLTYFNGLAQPFRQLSRGLARYETLQEGLAVLSEYLVGGLSRPRLRMLAARVVATHMLQEGAGFVEVFRSLRLDHGFSPSSAYATTARVFRGGGLTKDHVYLRGLHELLQWLRDGHRLAPLLVGKIALEHAPYVQELRRREVIHPPAARPRFADSKEFLARLERCRSMTLLDLIGTDT